MAREREDEIVFTNNVDKQYMLEKRKKVRLEKKIRSNAWMLRLLFTVLFVSYLASDISKVKCISVIGNDIFSKEYIEETSQLSFDSLYFGIVPSQIEKKLMKNPLIDHANVSRKGNNIVMIEIVEKKIIASFQKESQLFYLCEDGSLVEVSKESLDYMSKVPFIVDLETNDELLVKLAKPLGKVDEDVLSMMSEIVWYPLSYDEMQLKINMIDHNYVFISIYDIEAINDYRKIVSSLTKSKECIYFDSNATHPYTSECLFDIVEESEGESETESDTDDVEE